MPIYKCTILFNSGVQGWSESYYNDAANHAQAYVRADDLAQFRLRLCGTNIDVPFIRVSDITIRGDVSPPGQKGLTTTVGNPGFRYIKPITLTEPADVSWTAVIFNLSKDAINIGRVFARGLPDGFITSDRVFNPDTNWDKGFVAMAKFFKDTANGFVVLRKPKQNPANTANIISATAVLGTNLNVSHTQNIAFAAGQLVRVTGMQTTTGQRFSGNFSVSSASAGSVFLVKQFPDPQPIFVNNKGKIQQATPSEVQGITMSYEFQSCSRRSGRPFGSLVGRRKRVSTLK